MQMASYGSDCCCTRVLAGIVEQYIVPAALLCKDLSSSKPALAQASRVKLRCGRHLTCEVDCDLTLVFLPLCVALRSLSLRPLAKSVRHPCAPSRSTGFHGFLSGVASQVGFINSSRWWLAPKAQCY